MTFQNPLRLAHGSDHIVEKPIFGAGKKNNDYGIGFYCTESVDMAKEWGVGEDHDGYANIYDLDLTGLSILDLNDSEYCILHWLTLLMNNRTLTLQSQLASEAQDYLKQHFLLDVETYDAIYGYRADDSYFSFAEDFVNGAISYKQLTNAMKLGKLGQQFVLKSPRSFDQISYVGNEVATREDWLAKKVLRDLSARRSYFHDEKLRRHRGDIYITTILDEEMKPGDPRLR